MNGCTVRERTSKEASRSLGGQVGIGTQENSEALDTRPGTRARGAAPIAVQGPKG